LVGLQTARDEIFSNANNQNLLGNVLDSEFVSGKLLP